MKLVKKSRFKLSHLNRLSSLSFGLTLAVINYASYAEISETETWETQYLHIHMLKQSFQIVLRLLSLHDINNARKSNHTYKTLWRHQNKMS